MMIPAPHRRDQSLGWALLAAAALHLTAFWLAILLARPSVVPGGTAVPITIISSAPTTDSRRAEAAPETQTAQTERPVSQAPAPVPPPAPAAPKPAPEAPPRETVRPAPRPKPVPKPAPKPAPTPERTPEKPQAKANPKAQPTRDTFNLDALAASIARTTRPSPARKAFARAGPTRAETAPVARVDAGQGVSQSDLAGLGQILERLWNPNCDALAGGGLVVPVKFQLGDDGRVVGRITDGGRDGSSDPSVSAAARQAIDAVHRGEPWPAPYRGQTFTVNFDAQKACASH
jgi:outer membrane biosynthesis protein TonB